MTRVLTRNELSVVINGLPLPNKKDTPQFAEVLLPQTVSLTGEIFPGARLRFLKTQAQDGKGTLKWTWAYMGPLPYIDETIVVDKQNKTDLQPHIETERIVLP